MPGSRYLRRQVDATSGASASARSRSISPQRRRQPQPQPRSRPSRAQAQAAGQSSHNKRPPTSENNGNDSKVSGYISVSDDGSDAPHLSPVPEERARHRPITTIDWRAEICRVLQEPPSLPDEEILDKLGSALHELKEAQRLKRASDDNPHHGPPRHQVLYRISCSNFGSGKELYEDPPWLVEAGPYNAHLRGSNLIDNLELHLERNQDIVFIVYKDFECCETRLRPLERDPAEHADISDSAVISLLKHESVSIISEEMQDALEALASDVLSDIPHPDFTALRSREPSNHRSIGDADAGDALELPYFWWFHKREEIEEAIPTMNESLQRHLSLFRGYLHDRLSYEWSIVDELIYNGKMKAEYISYLYFPGRLLVLGPPEIAISDIRCYKATSFLHQSRRRGPVITVDLESWTFNGDFRKEKQSMTIFPLPRTTGEFDITDLNLYPLEFADKEVSVALLRRGRMFWKCRKRNYVSLSYEDCAGDGIQSNADLRFMIDMETYKSMHLKKKDDKNAFQEDEYSADILPAEYLDEDDPDLDDNFYLCLPPRIFGFNMQKKEWTTLDVHYLEDVKWNTKAFEYLVISPVTKELITAVVMNQLGGQANSDLISGKGNGLFMLLHGGPGTGKTLTAESVAEIAKRPLYRVTCGDIGTKAEEVERYLEYVLLIGKTWGCVVLLDEADVFLEQRSILNLERNALVSVFLRVLEYYDGILILTSNRVGIFDEAFKSRIQLSLRYNNLGQEQRLQVWNNFILHLDEFQKSVELQSPSASKKISQIGYGINVADLSKNVDTLSEANLNGREIRNALSTARQLALYRKEPLHYTHLQSVMNEAKKFEEYLKELHRGFSADEIQRSRQER